MFDIIIEKSCPICGSETEVKTREEDYIKWFSGALIQDAMPYLSAEDREVLISGICPKCQFRIFKEH